MNKGQKNSPETILKMRMAKLGHPVSKETREKLRLAKQGKILSPEIRRKISEANKGQKRTPETREKIRQNSIEQWANPKSRAIISEAVSKANVLPIRCRRISKAMKGRRPSDAAFEAVRKVNRARRGEKREKYVIKDKEVLHRIRLQVWQRPEYVRNQMRAKGCRPNKAEILLQHILDKYSPNEWKYVGDGELIIGGKCPDFVNIDGQKALIELFGDYWHQGENPQIKIDHYKQYGFECLVIWENELSDKEALMQKVRHFNE